jgi:hypothetical protein
VRPSEFSISLFSLVTWSPQYLVLECALYLFLHWVNIGANMVRTACEFAPIDPTGYLNFFNRHFGMGVTVCELSGIWLQYSSILLRSAISHRHHSLWRMVSRRLTVGMFDDHVVLLFRAGNPTVYHPQCTDSGPTGHCVRPSLDRITPS